MAIGSLHEAASAGLHDRHLPGVVSECAGDVRLGFEHADLRFGRSNAEILHELRIDADAPRSGTVSTGAFRDQLHVHERRLARLVEALIRHHRIVPVEHFLAACSRCGAVSGRSTGGTFPKLGDAVAGAEAHKYYAGCKRVGLLARGEFLPGGFHCMCSR